jgi:hypothetical protein
MRKITSRLGTLAILAGVVVGRSNARANAAPELVSVPSDGAATPTQTASPKPSPTATATVTSKPTTIPAAAPTPVSLASPIIVVAAGQPLKYLNGKIVPGGCTTAGDGSTDDTNCIQKAVNHGDVQVNAGHYVINRINNRLGWSDAVDIPSGRNVRCGAGTNPLDGTEIFSYNVGARAYSAFIMKGRGSFMGCSFRGPNYNRHPPLSNNKNQAFIRVINPRSSQVLIANNDFNGSGGYVADIDVNQPGRNTLITYNTAENCGYYFVQASGTHGLTVSHDILNDCSCCVESGGPAVRGVLIDHVSATFTYGNGVATLDAKEDNGTNFLTGGTDSSGKPFNYSGVTVQNSSCSGTIGAGLDEYVAGGNSRNCPTYINNRYTGSCQLLTGCPGGP